MCVCVWSYFLFAESLQLGLLGVQHQLWADILVKVLFAESLELQGTLLEGNALLVGILGYLGSHVVANNGVEAGHKHKTKYLLVLE